MKNILIKIVNGVVVLTTGFLVVLGAVVVVLNWPSFWQRLSVVNIDEQKVEAKEVKDEEKTIKTYDGEINSQYVLFPQFFVSKVDLDLENKYESEMSEESILIPKLGISSPIKYLNTLDDSVMKLTLKEGVVHYPDTAMPGEKGNVFIFGHSSYYWWDWSEYNSIFANLEMIGIGDEIIVKSRGRLLIYRVKNTKVVESNDLSVLEQGAGYNLTLMTCTPLGTDLRRFIVESELVN